MSNPDQLNPLQPMANQPVAGITMAEVLALPDAERQLINWMRRQTGCTFVEIMMYLRADEDTTKTLLIRLADQGFIAAIAQEACVTYRVCLASMRGRRLAKDWTQTIES